tara:strand:+ start:216 stop:656 length:441 start_codon:yes stop_codon:yes gene_type:complete
MLSGKIVYSYYCLDILHIGHLKMMEKSKQLAGKNGQLIAGILTNQAVKEKKKSPILDFEERFALASSIKYVDKVVAQHTYSPLENIKKIKPDILMESSSHDQREINFLFEYMNSIGGEVITIPYYERQSSSQIKKLIINEFQNGKK